MSVSKKEMKAKLVSADGRKSSRRGYLWRRFCYQWYGSYYLELNTKGSESDFKAATKLAYDMVTKYGMVRESGQNILIRIRQ